MREIEYVQVVFNVKYTSKYIHGLPYYDTKTQIYSLSEEEYNKVIKFIENIE